MENDRLAAEAMGDVAEGVVPADESAAVPDEAIPAARGLGPRTPSRASIWTCILHLTSSTGVLRSAKRQRNFDRHRPGAKPHDKSFSTPRVRRDHDMGLNPQPRVPLPP